MNVLTSYPYSYGLRRIVMRINLIIFLMTLAFLHVSASVDAQQRISLALKDVDIKQAFEAIEKQSGYGFWFQKEQLTGARKVTLRLQDVSLKEALDECFKGQPFTYEIVDKTIVVRVKAAPVTPAKVDEASRATVRGRVSDKRGTPLIGVSVRIKGTNVGTITDASGGYSIEANPSGVIVFSYLGFQTMEIKISGQSVIDMTLVDNDTQLDQVQVIAYGTTTRRMSTSNIGSVKAAEIQKQPVSNPILALQGRVPGLVISQQSGIPGGEVQVQIQGRNSLQSGNDPFYVIDGVPFNARMLPTTTSILSGSGSPFSYLNPGDIESIEVLKDADATSIYGSRAANGAILITTKKGKAGKTNVDLNFQSGWGKISRKMDLLNTHQYIALRKEAIQNDNMVIGPVDYDVNGVWDTTRYTDWQEELAGNNATFTNVQASVSGGTKETQFLVGAAFNRETTVFSRDFADTKGSVNFNINHSSVNGRFQLQFSGNYLSGVNKLPDSDIMPAALMLAPNAPALFNADGSLNWAYLPNGSATLFNPANRLLQKYDNRTANLVSSAVLSYELLPGLKLKSNFGFNSIISEEKRTTPITYFDPNGFFKQRSGYYANKYNKGIIIEPQLEYNKRIRESSINILIGSSYQQNRSDLEAFMGTGYNSDIELDNIKSASSVTVANTIQSLYRYNAAFGRINYNYSGKYIVNLAARRDGSSRFGSENRFHNFYSVAGGWIFSEEAFMHEAFSGLSFGKIRVSYGTTGNDQIGDYAYLSLYSPQTIGIAVPYQSVTGIAATGHANPYLKWELTRKFNAGLDLAFLSNRILVNVNYFNNSSSDQLLSNPLPVQTGFTSVQKNFPATVRNYGWEIQVNAMVVDKSLKWSTNLNITLPSNKLVSFPNLASTPAYANTYVIGEPITMIKTFKFSGVNSQTGVYEFVDSKGQITATPNWLTDRSVMINTAPEYYGGWGNHLSYKGFELDFLLQFTRRVDQNALVRFGNVLSGYFNLNQPASMLERWQQPGDIKDVQRANTTFSVYTAVNNANNSDAAYGDVSFISLRNASLQYNLPQNILMKVRIAAASVYAQGQNLLMITKFKGFNPESSASTVTPPLRMITLGLRVNI